MDCEYVQSLYSFSKALQLYPGRRISKSESEDLCKILTSSVGAVILTPKGLAVAEDADALFHAELVNRLSIPWVSENPAPRKTLAIVEGG